MLKIRAVLKQLDTEPISPVKYPEEIEKEIKELEKKHYDNVSNLKDLKMDEKAFKKKEKELREKMSEILDEENRANNLVGDVFDKVLDKIKTKE